MESDQVTSENTPQSDEQLFRFTPEKYKHKREKRGESILSRYEFLHNV